MVRNEVLLNQLKEYRHETLALMDAIPEDWMDVVPVGFNNSIRWNLGHMYVDQWAWIYTLERDESIRPNQKYRSLFGYGTRPSEWTEEPPSTSELRSKLEEQLTFICDNYGPRLDEVFPEPIDYGMQTIAEVLIRTIFHEGIHLNSIVSIKRAIEHETAVRSNPAGSW